MDMQQIQRIQIQAIVEGWTFGRHCDELLKHGVAKIRMKLRTGETEYTNGEGVTLIVSPLEPLDRACPEALDVPAIDVARQRYLNREIGLGELFDLLAVAGVWYSELDTRTKTVLHFDWKGQLQEDGFISATPLSGDATTGSHIPAASLVIRPYPADGNS